MESRQMLLNKQSKLTKTLLTLIIKWLINPKRDVGTDISSPNLGVEVPTAVAWLCSWGEGTACTLCW